jgi:hypothetical protein
VVSRGGGDDSPGALLGRKLRNEVDPSADFEGADRLAVFVLNKNLRADQLIDGRVAVKRGPQEVRADSPLGKKNIRKLREFHNFIP